MGIVAVFFVDHYSTVKLPGVFIAIPENNANFSAAERELLRHRFLYLRQVLPMIDHREWKGRKEKNGQCTLQLSCHMTKVVVY